MLNKFKETHAHAHLLSSTALKKFNQRTDEINEQNLNECRLDLKRGGKKSLFKNFNITTLIQAVLYLYRNVFINVQCLLIRIKVIDYSTISGCLKDNSFVPARSKTNTGGANSVTKV